MNILFLCIKAVFCGMLVAAPLGPMGVLCVRRTMAQGYKYGVFTALGVATSDTIYAVLAVLGVTSIYDFITLHAVQFHIGIGLFIVAMGVNIYYTKLEPETILPVKITTVSLPYAFFSAMFLTLANPVPLLVFVTFFTALAPPAGFDNTSSLVTIIGVFSGSFFWMLGIVASISALRTILTPQRRLRIDKITGLLLIVFGAWEIVRFL